MTQPPHITQTNGPWPASTQARPRLGSPQAVIGAQPPLQYNQEPQNQEVSSNVVAWQQQQQPQIVQQIHHSQPPQQQQIRIQQPQHQIQQVQRPELQTVQQQQSPSVQPGHHVLQSQVVQQAGQQQHLPNSQQQFIVAPGTRVVVGQPNWQQQTSQQRMSSPGQANQVTTAGQSGQQTLLPQHLQQIQVHAQQLRQHFPDLTQQEAQQLIQTIPTHLREIQSRDNAGRCEYLASLEVRERQIVNHFYIKRHQQQMLQRQQLQAQHGLKIGASQQSPGSWQQQAGSSQYSSGSPHGRTIVGRPIPQGFTGQIIGTAGQGTQHIVQGIFFVHVKYTLFKHCTF